MVEVRLCIDNIVNFQLVERCDIYKTPSNWTDYLAQIIGPSLTSPIGSTLDPG